MGAELMVGALIAGAGLMSGIASAASSSSNTQRSIDASAAENEKQREWLLGPASENERKMMQYQSDLQVEQSRQLSELYSPQKMVERLKAAGINPAAMLSQMSGFQNMGSSSSGGSLPSMPLANYQTQPSTVNFDSAIGSLSAAYEKFASAKNQDAQTKRTTQMLGGELRLLIAKSQNQELMNNFQELENWYQSKNMSNRIENALQDTLLKVSNTLFYEKSAEYLDEQALTEPFKRLGAALDADLKGEELTQAKIRTKYFENTIRTNLAHMKSEIAANQASAAESAESASRMKITNDMLLNNPHLRAAMASEITERAESLRKSNELSGKNLDMLDLAIEKMKFGNSKMEIDYWFDKAMQIIDRSLDGIDKFSKFGLVKSYLDGKKSNNKSESTEYPLNGYNP